MFSGFQSNAFQGNAFQIVRGTRQPEVSGFGYPMPYFEHREREYQREKIIKRRAELKRIEDEIAEKEKWRLEAINQERRVTKQKTVELTAIANQLQEEINRLRIERVWLMRLIDDEEAILVLLLSWPLH